MSIQIDSKDINVENTVQPEEDIEQNKIEFQEDVTHDEDIPSLQFSIDDYATPDSVLHEIDFSETDESPDKNGAVEFIRALTLCTVGTAIALSPIGIAASVGLAAFTGMAVNVGTAAIADHFDGEGQTYNYLEEAITGSILTLGSTLSAIPFIGNITNTTARLGVEIGIDIASEGLAATVSGVLNGDGFNAPRLLGTITSSVLMSGGANIALQSARYADQFIDQIAQSTAPTIRNLMELPATTLRYNPALPQGGTIRNIADVSHDQGSTIHRMSMFDDDGDLPELGNSGAIQPSGNSQFGQSLPHRSTNSNYDIIEAIEPFPRNKNQIGFVLRTKADDDEIIVCLSRNNPEFFVGEGNMVQQYQRAVQIAERENFQLINYPEIIVLSERQKQEVNRALLEINPNFAQIEGTIPVLTTQPLSNGPAINDLASTGVWQTVKEKRAVMGNNPVGFLRRLAYETSFLDRADIQFAMPIQNSRMIVSENGFPIIQILPPQYREFDQIAGARMRSGSDLTDIFNFPNQLVNKRVISQFEATKIQQYIRDLREAWANGNELPDPSYRPGPLDGINRLFK